MAAHAVTDGEKADIHNEFHTLVNMTPAKLRHWLQSEESRSVGMTPEGEKVTEAAQGESVGHHMGERILQIRAAHKQALTEADYADMRKVAGYVKRHSAQRPGGDVTNTRWRHSLMNWGHDPLITSQA